MTATPQEPAVQPDQVDLPADPEVDPEGKPVTDPEPSPEGS